MPPHYHPLADEEPITIEELLMEYDNADGGIEPGQLQADLVGVLMGLGEQTFDDSVKRNAVISLIETLAFLDRVRGVESVITYQEEDVEFHGQTFLINAPVLSSTPIDDKPDAGVGWLGPVDTVVPREDK